MSELDLEILMLAAVPVGGARVGSYGVSGWRVDMVGGKESG